jgi:glycine reductase complex component B subunit gamma
MAASGAHGGSAIAEARVVHYLNQFFATLGGEDAAGVAPTRIEGAVGPGRILNLDVVSTVACGDDYFAEHEGDALRALLAWIRQDNPDAVVCGPAFGSGRYGYACGCVMREVARLGIPVVGAMDPENPGVLAAEGAGYILRTESSVGAMRSTLPRIDDLVRRLAAAEAMGTPEEEGYLPIGLRRNRLAERSGAARAVDMLLDKLGGTVRTEVAPRVERVAPPVAIDPRSALLALVTEAGCVPQGNPDGLTSRRATRWLRYDLAGVETMSADRFQSVHAGFDLTAATADPNRLVPLDAVRELEREGAVGRLYPFFYTTTGVDTPVATAARMGAEIATELRDDGVEAVILTGT